MRVLIIGASCSGKTYYSNSLSNDLNIPFYDLDFAHFDRDFNTLSADVRKNLLNEICSGDSWVVSGILDYQINECVRRATYLIWLEEPGQMILIFRYFRRALSGERSLRSAFDLSMLKWLLTYRARRDNGYKSHKTFFELFTGVKMRTKSNNMVRL